MEIKCSLHLHYKMITQKRKTKIILNTEERDTETDRQIDSIGLSGITLSPQHK